MAHFIQAIIGYNNHLENIARRLNNAVVVKLYEEISLIPITHELKNELNKIQDPTLSSYANSFEFASKSLMDLLINESTNGMIGYIETNYFGGTGSQSSILFTKREVYGPFTTESLQMDEARPINLVLKILGVMKEESTDEFSKVGLVHLRSNSAIAQKNVI